MYHGSMRTQSLDTSPEAEQVQIALLRAAPVWRRLGIVNDLTHTTRFLSAEGWHRWHPDATGVDVRRQMAALWYGAEAAERVVAHAATREEQPVDTPGIIEVTLMVTAQLEAQGVRYALGGSMASSALGMARSTMDADIIADLAESDVEPLVRALEGSFYIDADAISEAIRHRSSTNLIHLESMFKVDLFIPKRRAFDRNQLARRVARKLAKDAQQNAFVASAEDTVLAKLEWYRMGGEISDRQWTDILGVLKVQAPGIDLPYLRQWAPALGVTDLLARALDDAGLA